MVKKTQVVSIFYFLNDFDIFIVISKPKNADTFQFMKEYWIKICYSLLITSLKFLIFLLSSLVTRSHTI